MQDWLLQIMQLVQYPHVSLFSTVITNEFIGEDFYLSQHSMDSYTAMRFDVTQLTQDMEQNLIFNKDQHANTCVSVWGHFPVAKIWSSHITIKSRFDKP
jgi:hypothetical protein